MQVRSFFVTSAGRLPETVRLSNDMYSGVVPQQPPSTLTPQPSSPAHCSANAGASRS